MAGGAAKVTMSEQDLSFFIQQVTEGRNCMLLTARRGPINQPRLIGSTVQYRETYGVPLASTDIDQVIQRALDRGAVLWLNRVAHYTDPADPTSLDADKASLTLKNASAVDTLTLNANSEGAWGNGVIVQISANAGDANRFDLTITYPEQPTMNERWNSLTMNANDERYAVVFLNANSKLIEAVDEEAGDPLVGDTVTVASTTLTAGTDFAVDIDDISSMASALAAAIETNVATVNATSTSNVVTVTAATAGTSGNSIALSTVSNGSNITASGSTLSGGAAAVAASATVTYGSPSNGDTITVDGTVFTKAASGSGTEFSSISELTALIAALSSVNATDNGTTITVVAATAGTAGNAITIAKTGSALTLGNATGGHLNSGAAAVAASGTLTFDPTPTVIDNPAVIGPLSLSGGSNGAAVDDDDFIGASAGATGFHAFSDVDDAFGLAAPEAGSPAVVAAGIAYCEAREDMVYYCEPPSTDVDTVAALDFRYGRGDYSHSAFNSSYGAMYFGRPKIRSAKTNNIVDISNLGDVFGVHAYSDRKSEVWFAPAGLQRGRIPNTLGVHYNVGTPGRSSELDQLADAQINPIVDFKQDGTVVWDEQTLQTIPSATQSLHVRRLLVYMRKALLQINRLWLFEPNDPVTWRRVFNLIDPWMSDLLSRRAFYEYHIQCDQDARSIDEAILNTPERIDRGEFVCRIFIKPTRTLKYFSLEAVITKSSADFTELMDIRL